jgi:glycosyltransferase involved in cell wall biosynthesis
MEFSVLMSVYEKDNHNFLIEALDSILVNQTVVPNELVLVKDGPLTMLLDEVITSYQTNFPLIIKVISQPTNKGLGEALRIGLNSCNFEIIARMDSDDISHHLRFEKQLEILQKNRKLDLVGSNIAEFFETPAKINFIRKVPLSIDNIKKMIKRRNPINHVSVMFKKSAVLNSGGYRHLPFIEDYYLWVRMLANGSNLINMDETLVFVRTGKDMFKRRSNPIYIQSWYILQKYMYKYNLINIMDIIINMVNIVIFTYTPVTLKKYIYKYFLRSSK